MSFPVGKLGGFFSSTVDSFNDAKDFTNRQLDTVIDVSGSVRDTASSAQNAISGGTSKPPAFDSVEAVKGVSPVVWVGIAAIGAYFLLGKK